MTSGRGLALFVLAVLVVFMTGCASPARIQRMEIDPSLAARTAAANSPLRENVTVRDVTGGRETNPLWTSQVSSSDFHTALESSLRNAGLLSSNRQSSKYELVAQLVKLDQPFMGFDMTVTAHVEYTLIERSTRRTVYARTIVTPYTATMSSSFFGVERLKLANEGSIRANIARVIEDLIALKTEGQVGPPT